VPGGEPEKDVHLAGGEGTNGDPCMPSFPSTELLLANLQSKLRMQKPYFALDTPVFEIACHLLVRGNIGTHK
jgi:hypothetical protein